jgi:hypothetical protein
MEVPMLRSRLASLFVWSAGTFAVALALGLPATTNAVDDANSPSFVATILTAHVSSSGIELSVSTGPAATDGTTTQPSKTDKQPLKLYVTAVDKTDASATGDFAIRLQSLAPVNPASRVPGSTEIWKDSGSIVLNAGASKTLTFTPSSVPSDKVIRVIVTFGDRSALMLSLAPQKLGQLVEVR